MPIEAPTDPTISWTNTTELREALTPEEKERIRTDYRLGRRSQGAMRRLDFDREKRISVYERRFGRPYDPQEPDPTEYECALCDDTGQVMAAANDEDAVRWNRYRRTPCECVGGRPWPDFDPVAARVPLSLRRRHTVWAPNEAAREMATAWLRAWPPEEPFLTLMGEPGRGKSQLACLMLAEAYEQHHVRGQFWGVVEILDRIKATFDEDERFETTERAMGELIGWPLLVIDDLGAGRATEWSEERLYVVVNARHEAMRPTIVTANPSGPGWEKLHPRLKSRVLGNTVRLVGADRRIVR